MLVGYLRINAGWWSTQTIMPEGNGGRVLSMHEVWENAMLCYPMLMYILSYANK